MSLIRGLLAGGLLIAFCANAAAQDVGGTAVRAVPEQKKGWHGFIGGAIGASPDYYGSDDYEVGFAPLAQINYNEYFLRVRGELAGAGVLEMSANVMPDIISFGKLNIGPLLQYRRGRGSVEEDAVDDLRNIDPAIEAGGYIEYSFPVANDPRQRLAFEFKGAHDISDEHDGAIFGLRSRFSQPFTDEILGVAEVFSHWGTESFMSTYFGVDSDDARRSGLDRFNADDDFRNIGFAVIGNYQFAENWGVTAVGAYSRLLGDAEDSPIVDDVGSPNLFFAGVGLSYSFGL